jgi:predicted nucleic acid-binding protein
LKLIVPDVSVAAKWYVPAKDEEFVDESFELLDLYKALKIDFVVPDFFWAEFGNVLWKAVRRGRMQEEQALLALSDAQQWGIETIATKHVLDRAVSIALANGRTVYDSLYVALAVQKDCPMVTADERLVNTLGSRFPVRFIGSFSIT